MTGATVNRVEAYALDANRTPHGAALLLKALLDESLQASQLAFHLERSCEGARPTIHTLQLIQLRVREAQILMQAIQPES